ncbi:MAG: thioredoxin family protein [Planctomycetota bacterium]
MNLSNDLEHPDCKEAVPIMKKRVEDFRTLYSSKATTRQLQGVDLMILLFTSDNCAWCGVLKAMLDDEGKSLGTEQQVYEVNVEKQHRIAEAYGILVVPTLVAGSFKISGVPTPSDLRSFMLQAVSRGFLRTGTKMVKSVLRDVRQIRASDTLKDQIIGTIS